jgi:DNA repair exonuclease SbcCD ATPase subunit
MAIAKHVADRKLLVAKGQEERAKRLEAIVNAVEESQRAIGRAKLQLQALSGLQSDVKDFRERRAPEWIADIKEARADALLSDDDWKSFALQFVGDVDDLLKTRVNAIEQHVGRLEGPTPSECPSDPSADPAVALIAGEAALRGMPLRLQERERDRLQRLVGIDAQNARRYKQLSETIAKTQTALARVSVEIERAEKADDEIKALRDQRSQAYRGIFEAVIHEERELGTLYEPLGKRIAGAKGTLAKLSFSVRRIIDLEAWAARGEELLDLRTSGPFRGKGELRRIAEAELFDPWLRGDSKEVADAMNQFVATHGDSLRSHRPAQANYREWARKVVGWLYSTDHISVGYGLQYEGSDIEQLSSGTRGIVLLLLYLAIDADDDRPLIIDQPEENLDPQSVFQDLVPAFREARRRRQIIIVTHNANLVINTDVDQVIVARCGPHRLGQLPEITYMSGGLENAAVRGAVCAVLEGGERAFRERARRLRISV